MRSETPQCSSLLAALHKVRTGKASLTTLKGVINVTVANKIYNIRGLDIVLEVEYLSNGWVKKDGVNANLV